MHVLKHNILKHNTEMLHPQSNRIKKSSSRTKGKHDDYLITPGDTVLGQQDGSCLQSIVQFGYGSKKPLLHPWGRTSPYLSSLWKYLALQIFSPIQDLSLRGGRCAVLGCSTIFKFVQLQNINPTIPGDPFTLKLSWPMAMSGVPNCQISQREGKCVKLKECRQGYRWGESRPCVLVIQHLNHTSI